MQLRHEVALHALNDALEWLSEARDGDVAIFDATNTTLDRRSIVHERVVVDSGHPLLFIESICTNQDLIDDNILEVKVSKLYSDRSLLISSLHTCEVMRS